MENPALIASILGPMQVVIGISILLKSKTWHKLVEKISKDSVILMPLSILHLLFGLLVLQVYSAWTPGIWLLITLSGWAMVLKGGLYILLPEEYTKKWIAAGKNVELMKLAAATCAIIGVLLSTYAVWG